MIYYKSRIIKFCAYSSGDYSKMEFYTVALFGHRDIDDLRGLEAKLTPIVKTLIETKPYVDFLIGRMGEFDEYAASVIKTVRKQLGSENTSLTLVLPYTVADIEYYEKYYDSVLIPESLYGTYPKSAITLKNKWMVERANLVVAYVERESGGAYTAMKYAEKIGKDVINLCLENDKYLDYI